MVLSLKKTIMKQKKLAKVRWMHLKKTSNKFKKTLITLFKATAAADRPYLNELYELIESVKGVGPVIATEILIVTARAAPK